MRKTVIFFITFSIFFVSLARSSKEEIVVKRKDTGDFHVELKRASIHKALSALSKEVGCEIYVQESIKGTISLSYANIRLEKLLKKIGRGYQVLFKYSGATGGHRELRYVKIFKTGGISNLKENKIPDKINTNLKIKYRQAANKPNPNQVDSKEPLSGIKFIEKLKVFGQLMQLQDNATPSATNLPPELEEELTEQDGSPVYMDSPETQFNMRKSINNRIKAYRSRVDFQTIDNTAELDGL